ncbi:T9SS type A sorting domain-containing protein [Flavobacterium sp.]|uniref:T9SS type A sorting domain-containing protein n=1 Tax=Flavobacterium sp. TaxID=239 RepID=UPI0039E53F26
MKTKLLFPILLLFSVCQQAFSQEYHPLLNNTSWVVSDWVSCCRPPIFEIIAEGTDEVIGIHTYKKFIDPFPSYDPVTGDNADIVYIREEVGAQKVYRMVSGVEELIYDFSLENGDQITLEGVTFTAAIEDMAVNTGVRKKITLESVELFNGQHVYQTWIEGVGSIAHPFYPDFYMYASVFSSGGGYRVFTRCMYQDGEHVFGNPPLCASQQMGVSEHAIQQPQITFSPNPFASEMTIDAEKPLANATFKLYNVQGQLVMEIHNLKGKKASISRANLSSGLYFAQLSENNQLVKSQKVTVH